MLGDVEPRAKDLGPQAKRASMPTYQIPKVPMRFPKKDWLFDGLFSFFRNAITSAHGFVLQGVRFKGEPYGIGAGAFPGHYPRQINTKAVLINLTYSTHIS